VNLGASQGPAFVGFVGKEREVVQATLNRVNGILKQTRDPTKTTDERVPLRRRGEPDLKHFPLTRRTYTRGMTVGFGATSTAPASGVIPNGVTVHCISRGKTM
jgi:hypothetical protein